jgi:hypothetical protein
MPDTDDVTNSGRGPDPRDTIRKVFVVIAVLVFVAVMLALHLIGILPPAG